MFNDIIQLNEDTMKQELSVLGQRERQKTLNELLDQEADHLANAKRYERTSDLQDTRAGHY